MIGPRDIKVPNFKGKTVEEAESLADRNGLKLDVVGYVKSNKYDAGEVAQQDPETGFMARKNETIEVKVSKGSDTAVIPNVVGKKEEEATKLLEDMGYKVKIREVTDPKPADEVLRQDPNAGEKLKKGEIITLEVSNGKGKEKVSVPNLLGLSQQDAESKLKNAGLSAGKVSSGYSDTYSDGKVMEQQYEAGQQIDKGSSVSFTVSKGSQSKEGSVDIDVDLTEAPGDDDVVYMTVSVNDDNGPHNAISDRKMNRNDGSIAVNINGKGTGTVTVILNGTAVSRQKVDFSSGN
jgi:serine/threonine-protein kinase